MPLEGIHKRQNLYKMLQQFKIIIQSRVDFPQVGLEASHNNNCMDQHSNYNWYHKVVANKLVIAIIMAVIVNEYITNVVIIVMLQTIIMTIHQNN